MLLTVRHRFIQPLKRRSVRLHVSVHVCPSVRPSVRPSVSSVYTQTDAPGAAPTRPAIRLGPRYTRAYTDLFN